MGARTRTTSVIVAAVVAIGPAVVVAPAATAAPTVSVGTAKIVKFPNCTALHKRFPHGVGKVGARDRTTSRIKVTAFTRSNLWYAKNAHLDRDKDGIACEKR